MEAVAVILSLLVAIGLVAWQAHKHRGKANETTGIGGSGSKDRNPDKK